MYRASAGTFHCTRLATPMKHLSSMMKPHKVTYVRAFAFDARSESPYWGPGDRAHRLIGALRLPRRGVHGIGVTLPTSLAVATSVRRHVRIRDPDTRPRRTTLVSGFILVLSPRAWLKHATMETFFVDRRYMASVMRGDPPLVRRILYAPPLPFVVLPAHCRLYPHAATHFDRCRSMISPDSSDESAKSLDTRGNARLKVSLLSCVSSYNRILLKIVSRPRCHLSPVGFRPHPPRILRLPTSTACGLANAIPLQGSQTSSPFIYRGVKRRSYSVAKLRLDTRLASATTLPLYLTVLTCFAILWR